MTDFFDNLQVATRIDGPSYTVSRESIREFCEASLDFNPLHLDAGKIKLASNRPFKFDGRLL